MGTKPVRFEFMCEKGRLKYTHNLPSSLVTPDPNAAQSDPQYMETFVESIQSVTQEHYATCLAASPPQCGICNSKTTKVSMTPTSWLHVLLDPNIVVYVAPMCDKPECDLKTRQQMQDFMALMSADAEGMKQPEGIVKPKERMEVGPCRVCDKTEKTFRCAGCKVVFYCGKEHQKEDWPLHKAICKKVAKGL